MDVASLIRMFGGLATVLGLLAGALWVVRRYDVKLPGRLLSSSAARRLELIERLPIDGRRSAVLIRRDDREHLVLIAPEGVLMLDPLAIDRQATSSAPRRRKRDA
jgi:flagellar biogenesis protein FliO